MRTGIRHTGSVNVVDDGGQRRVVDEYMDILEEGTLSYPGAELDGMREFRLGDDHCNVEKDGSFVVVRTGQRLRRT